MQICRRLIKKHNKGDSIMGLAKFMLSLTAAVWIIYGGWLFFDPKGLMYAGFKLDHWSTIVEVQAMYGLAEVALGIFALLGVLKPQKYMHSALLLWFMIYTGLVIGRIVGIIQWDGSFAMSFGPEGLPDSYNPGAMYFLEIPSSILLGLCLLRTREQLA
jgi:hypothetical protein